MLKPVLIILLAGLSVSSMLTPALNDFINFLIDKPDLISLVLWLASH